MAAIDRHSGSVWITSLDEGALPAPIPHDSSLSLTMDTYQHLTPTMQDAGTTRAIEEAIGGTLAEGVEDA